MDKDSDPFMEIPEELLTEIYEAERGLMPRRRGGRRARPYPTMSVLYKAVEEAARSFHGHPDDFPDYVISVLKEQGFDTRHVTVKRIWRCYELLVCRGGNGRCTARSGEEVPGGLIKPCRSTCA